MLSFLIRVAFDHVELLLTKICRGDLILLLMFGALKVEVKVRVVQLISLDLLRSRRLQLRMVLLKTTGLRLDSQLV